MSADENNVGESEPGGQPSPHAGEATRVTELIGIYHADGGLVGELRYIVGKLRGTAHCALCDVTHGLTGKKQSFQQCESAMPVPVKLLHLNERPADVLEASRGVTPCVLARTEQGLRMLLGPAALDALGGRVRAFEVAVSAAMRDAGMTFTS